MALLDSLPNGEILVTDELKITPAQLDAEIGKSPQQLQEQLRNNAFFVLEGVAIEKLLAKEAGVWARSKKLNTTKMKEDMLIRNYLQDLTADVTVGTDEAKRSGGVSEWVKVVGICQANGILMAPHLVPQFHVHLVAAAPNGFIVECGDNKLQHPSWPDLFPGWPEVKDGYMECPTEPGWGLTINDEMVKKHGTILNWDF